MTLALFGIPPLIIGLLLALLVREDQAYRERARASGSFLGAAARGGRPA